MQPPPESAGGRASSSSACSTAQRRTAVGCMAGLLRLFSPYQRGHHWKRLTAKLQPCCTAAPPPPSSTPSKKKTEEAALPSPLFLSPVKTKPMQQPQQPAVTQRRRSCDDAPRSPTIAPEHRRFSCDSSRPPPTAVVARLMGLEESAPPSPAAVERSVVLPTRPPPPPPSPPPLAAPETAAEKRRKLLGALEKCDEDLKTLRRIIAAVRAAEMRGAAAAAPDVVATMSSATPPPPGDEGSRKLVLGGRGERSPSPSPQELRSKPRAEKGYQHPSPDSVLGAVVTSPRFPCRKRGSPGSTEHDAQQAVSSNGAVVPGSAGTTKVVKPSRTFVLSGDYCKTKPAGDEPHAAAVGAHHLPEAPAAAHAEACALPARLPRAESWRLHRRRWELEAAAAGRVINRAMVESVSEAWGQRWEGGWVAASLEPAILQDMVTDVVAELLAQAGYHGDAAGFRRRLRF